MELNPGPTVEMVGSVRVRGEEVDTVALKDLLSWLAVALEEADGDMSVAADMVENSIRGRLKGY